MECPMQFCDYVGTLRAVERHRHNDHGMVKWDIAHDLPPGEPDAEAP